jgi:hypothetical protein
MRRKIRRVIAKIEMVEPIVERTFQVENRSLYSLYFRGIPPKPTKWRGKKVRLTPTNSKRKKEIIRSES